MIVVAGEALIDLIVRPDGQLVPVAGGGPYNTARAIGRLGLEVAWLGGLSRDHFGQMLEAGLVADGVSLALAERTDLPTTLAVAEIDEGGAATYRFYVAGTSAPAVAAAVLAAGLPSATRAVHVGTLGLVLEPMAMTLEALVAELPGDVLLMVDPNCRPSIIPDPDRFRARIGRVLARADVVKVSIDDLAYLVPGATADDAARRVVAVGPRVVLVTDGARPVQAWVDGAVCEVEAPTVTVVDTVGAGDTFGGAFLACLLAGGGGRETIADPAAVQRAVRFAVRASAMVCERPGADPPTLAQLGGWPAA
ncbi:MAG: carbohydrate kinase [Chloroflexota bacterium]